MSATPELDAALFHLSLRDAVRAPSSHNSQPWRFHVAGRALDVRADRARALPVVDPDGRELTISCGAAVGHLCVSLRHHGVRPHVDLLPEPADPDLLARVTLGPRIAPSDDDHALFHAVAERHTNRGPFERRAVPLEDIVAVRDAAEAEGAFLLAVQERDRRHALAALIAEGDREQWANPAFRAELAAWMRPNRTDVPDGMPGHAVGIDSNLLSRLGPLMVRRFDRGDGQAAHDSDLAEGAPLLAVLATAHDTPRDWMIAGLALSRLLLRATVHGLAASFLDQPIEVPRLRREVSALLHVDGTPQLVLRFGYGPTVQPVSRRPVEDVLT
jgi:nitroreductase